MDSSYRVTEQLQWPTLFTLTQYGDCDQTRFLSSLGSHKFFYGWDKHKNNYKVDYQRLKDLSWDTIWVKSINTKYDKIIHFKLHTEYGYFWELFLKWTEFIPKMGIFLERFAKYRKLQKYKIQIFWPFFLVIKLTNSLVFNTWNTKLNTY